MSQKHRMVFAGRAHAPYVQQMHSRIAWKNGQPRTSITARYEDVLALVRQSSRNARTAWNFAWGISL